VVEHHCLGEVLLGACRPQDEHLVGELEVVNCLLLVG